MIRDYPYPQYDKSYIGTVDVALEKYAERECLKFKGESYSYKQVDELSAKVANKMMSLGFEKGMHGAVYSLNSAVAFISALGIIRAGGVWIPVNVRNSIHSNREALNKLGCDVLFYQDVYEDIAQQVKSDGLCQTAIVSLENKTKGEADTLWDWIEGASASRPVIDIVGSDLLTLPQTGGTTGFPKGVMISHRNFNCVADMQCSHIFKPDGVMLCAAPMTHAGGRYLLATLSLGLRYIVIDKVDVQIVLKAIEDEKVTDVFLPPTVIYNLLDQPNFDLFDLSSLRRLMYGSAPMDVGRLKEAVKRIGPIMNTGFGQTECPLSISFLPAADHFIDGEIAEHRIRSVGRAIPCTVLTILDDDYNELPIGERGEIALKSPSMCEGYYQDPEQTAKIRQNGWHLTGDIGYLDEEGYLFISGRKKEMIITGGFNVYPAEIEQTLMSLPGVKLAAVIGVPDEKWGEAVTAFLEADSDDLDTENIKAQCKMKLGSVKTPKSIKIIKEIPRTHIGKIDKKALAV